MKTLLRTNKCGAAFADGGLADSMAPGTWAGKGTQPGDGHRWLKLGGILWRVLEVYEYSDSDTSIVRDSVTPPVSNGDKIAFLLAEKPVGAMLFNGTNRSKYGIKKWLNTDFLSTLDDVEQAIVTSRYNLYTLNASYGKEIEAQSKLFLLSLREAYDRRYFYSSADRTIDYCYWLRSPASYLSRCVMNDSGFFFSARAPYITCAIRPALKINLSSPIFQSSNYQTLYPFTVRVEDAADNSPIPCAAVAVTGKFYTNSKGEAELRLHAGSHTLTATAPGFAANAETAITVPSALAQTLPTVKLTADAARPDRVYFGSRLWRVLDTDGDTAFFLSDGSVAKKEFDPSIGNWKKSTIKTWLNTETKGNFLYSFTAAERKAIKKTLNYTLGGIYTNKLNRTTCGWNTTDSSKVFLLSVEEVRTYLVEKTARKLNNAGEYWLRSPGDSCFSVALVSSDGDVFYPGWEVDFITTFAVRPAFNLKLSSVLFTSAAAGGKNFTGLFPISKIQGDPGTPAKLTLLDGSIKPPKVVFYEPDKTELKFDYYGAPSAEAGWTHISCLLEKGGEVKYYGKLTALGNTYNGTVDNVSLSAVSSGTYILKIFFEQVNADKVTDYAGKPAVMTLTVNDGHGTILPTA